MANKPNKQKIENSLEKPPVVVILGHVDHGKSSLLEAIRDDFIITSKESGGITQHIGAYEVTIPSKKASAGHPEILRSAQDDFAPEGRKITFVDTPGHEAFSAMRQRGAKVADVAVLVVDAGEGVKAQTKEAIKFAKQANLPMIVALNKIDKPGANPEKVKQELSKEEIVVEQYGGKIPCCLVSAKTKKGIDELLETILLVAEMEELKIDTESQPEGTIIESQLDPQKGPIASAILNKGILKKSDIIATASSMAKVKGLADFQGREIDKASPGQPVSILGFEIPPSVGEKFKFYQTAEQARIAVAKGLVERKSQPVIEVAEGVKVFNIVLKTDVLGSAEAIEGILKDIPQEKVILRVLKAEVGDINITDVKTAESGHAKIFGFRVNVEESARIFAEQKEVAVKTSKVIYELVQEIRKAMLSVMDLEAKRAEIGKFKITIIFKQEKDTQIIGGKVLNGLLLPHSQAEIFRDNELLGLGRIRTIQQDKKEVGKVEKGREAAMLFQSDIPVAENDTLSLFRIDKQKGVL